MNLLYKDKVGRPPPGTTETQSTSATGNLNPDGFDNEPEESKCTEIDFHDLYYKYANQQNEQMREVAASCLHEGFLLASPMEDIKKLQMTFLELLEEDNKEIILALVPNMKTLIERYINEHALSLLPDEAPRDNDTTPTKNFALGHSNTFGARNDFGSINRKYELPGGPSKGFKKLTSMNVGAMEAQEDRVSG